MNLRKWWSGRPYHKVVIYSTETGKKLDTLRFRDDEWAHVLLAMGSLGCRTVDDALRHALELTVEHAQWVLDEQTAPSSMGDTPTGQYL